MSPETLSSVLFNQKKLSVLKILLNNKEKKFTVTELEELSEASRPVVTEFIDNLDHIGIVEKKKHGNAYLIGLNKDSDYLTYLQEILELDTAPMVETAKHFKEELVEELGEKLEGIVLYGSVARNAPKINSDIDILVIAENKNDSIEDKIKGITKKVKDSKNITVSPLVMSVEEVEQRADQRDEFLSSVVEDGKPLHGEQKWSEIQKRMV